MPGPDLDARQPQLQLPGEFRVASGEARGGCTGQATVAEQQSERIRVHGDFAVREADGRTVKRQLVPVIVTSTKIPDHLAGGQYSEGLAAAAVVAGGYGPQVIPRGQRRGAVLGGDPVDVLLALGVHTDHRCGPTVGSDD